MAVQDEVLHASPGVEVTKTQITINNTMYATANITSVSMQSTPPSRSMASILFLLGVLCLLVAVIVAKDAEALVGMTCVIMALAPLLLGVVMFKMGKTTYFVAIASSAGEVQALTTKDKEVAEDVVQAIKQAIISRG